MEVAHKQIPFLELLIGMQIKKKHEYSYYS